MKKTILTLTVLLLLVSCSNNETPIENQSSEIFVIGIETNCKSEAIRKYNISTETKKGIDEFIGKHGTDCTRITFTDRKNEERVGYFVKYF